MLSAALFFALYFLDNIVRSQRRDDLELVESGVDMREVEQCR